MILRRIEMRGFKSFADRTELEFVPGITAVVGPNGSGKSNITDAMRWVLGEQRAKSLRGTKMEDVIFAGSDSRKPIHYCEVSLTFDNSDGVIPLDYQEVTVTRRVFRSGESEYLINQQECRLKDIQELFMDTGVGKESYSMIGQGRIDELLNSRPEERRAIFEEAAGITKYKMRKREAEKKLEETENNLTRIQDILSELQEQSVPLAHQSEKAKTYQSLYTELSGKEISLYVHKIEALHSEWAVLQSEEKTLQETLLKHSTEVSRQEAEVQQKQQQIAEYDKSIEENSQALLRLVESYEKLEASREVLKERAKYLEKQLMHIDERRASLQSKRQQQLALLQQEQADLAEIQRRLEDSRRELKEKEGGDDEVAKLSAAVSSHQSLLFDHLNEMVKIRNEIKSGEASLATVNKQMERHQAAFHALEEERRSVEQKRGEIEQQLSALSYKRNELTKQYQSQTRLSEEKKEQLQHLRQQITGEEKTLNAMQSRLDMAKEMQEDFAGFSQGAKAVLKAAKRGLLKGIHGAVAELIQVPKAIELAVETALGAALQHIVVEDEARGREAIAYLKQHQSGRTTLLPLNVIKPRQIPAHEVDLIKTDEGFVGIGSELVACDSVYRPVVGSLLGTLVISRTLKDANVLAKRLSYRYRVVTLEGDIVNPGGSMTGGSVQKRQVPLLGRKREIEQMYKAVQQKIETLRQLETEALQLEQVHKDLQSAVEGARMHNEQLLIQEQALKAELSHLETQMRTLGERLAALQFERDEWLAAERDTQQNLKAAQNKLLEMETEENRLREELESLEKQLTQARQMQSEANEQITQLKVAIAERGESLRNKQSQVEQVKAALAALESESEQLTNEKNAAETELLNGEKEDKELQEQLKSQTGLRLELETRLAEEKKLRLSLVKSIEDMQGDIRYLRQQLNGVEQQAKSLAVQVNRKEVALDAMIQRLAQQYEMSYELAKSRANKDIDPEQVENEVYELKRRIQQLGPINLGAIEEYERLTERLTFILTQHEDLVKAKETLYQVIHDMEEAMSKRFANTFHQIRDAFQTAFSRLFGGGRADLVLTQPEQPLETGVDIVAQPPGKKLQHLSLLSGGERALTAIALLFAMLHIRPVPFCVLDEVEAALDEANVSRFVQYLKQYCDSTQFIVVTHRRGTMEGADVLYGVTMEESGVSRLISVRLEEVKEDLVS